MVMRWIEGFQSSATHDLLSRLYVSSGSGQTISNVTGPDSVALGAVQSNNAKLTTPSLGTAASTWVIGFAFQADVSGDDVDGAGVSLSNTDGEQLRLETVGVTLGSSKPGGNYYRFQVVRGATVLATTDQKFLADNTDVSWYQFEWKATINNSTGSFELRYRSLADKSDTIKTATWDSATTGLDTRNQASDDADRISICWDTDAAGAARVVSFARIYALDSTGASNNDYLGGVTIEALKPSGDGAQLDWVLAGGATDIQDAWESTSTALDDDERVTSDTTNDISLATMAGLTNIQDDNILCVRHDLFGRMESATGSLGLRHRYRNAGGTQGDIVGTFTVSSTANTAHSVVMEQEPVGSVDWTLAELASGQFGVRNGG